MGTLPVADREEFVFAIRAKVITLPESRDPRRAGPPPEAVADDDLLNQQVQSRSRQP